MSGRMITAKLTNKSSALANASYTMVSLTDASIAALTVTELGGWDKCIKKIGKLFAELEADPHNISSKKEEYDNLIAQAKLYNEKKAKNREERRAQLNTLIEENEKKLKQLQQQTVERFNMLTLKQKPHETDERYKTRLLHVASETYQRSVPNNLDDMANSLSENVHCFYRQKKPSSRCCCTCASSEESKPLLR